MAFAGVSLHLPRTRALGILTVEIFEHITIGGPREVAHSLSLRS